ncbi:hypothetical protein HK100_008413 [Physocladia obscura]|uniref:Coatomer subunit alpha n=1 Tax=Physocladia obscura TaxID=109957 RepID=A0AAD5T6L0_9FUNG|nr:hypothetical protein HK100_008413 [Physocladia obscura]
MLTKFETKSNRVKALSFHPKRPWILSGLHNGSLQLWDYKIGTLIDRFDEHEGPVRGVAFHPTQPLFVSGADDYKIKVWNWKQRRCLFTLMGHLDYIRSVQFHSEHPWIISCSDDQTIRIWNWQSRNCIATLTGHTYYVMSALFHPKDDLVVSSSLDQTIRVWDISGLRKKHASPQSMQFEDMHRGSGPGAPGNPDMFGNTDVIVKFVLEGHDRGVNWASFHPSLPLIVSGSDDRQIKLWRYNETRAWEVDTLRGHYNNINAVLFHPRQELVISAAEDKTICVWDMNKRTRLHTFRQENDRFWTLCAHPEFNLFAAGHDNGFTVFKLERERPAQSMYQTQLFYVKDKIIRMHDFSTSNDIPLLSIKKGAALTTPPRTMSYNPAEHSVLICSSADGGTYEMYNLPKDMSGDAREASGDIKKGQGNAAVFVGRNRFAVLSKQTQQIVIKDLANQPTKNFKTPGLVNDIFYGGSKNLILVTPTSVILFDTELKTSVAELNVSGVRYAVWSPDQSMVALFSKNALVIATKQLEQLCLIHETIRIKSGAWDEMGIFVYSTQNHIKYALPQGDVGIIRTVEQPIYLTKVKGKSLYCLDRDGKIRVIMIDPSEYRFKLALVRRNYDEVLHIIRTSNLVGQSIIAYLQKKGYPEVALHFVKEIKTRFELALQCGNLDVAEETAKVLDREESWDMLGQEALRQGNHKVFERALQRVKNYDRLSFLYFISGNTENLKKMAKIAELRGDAMSRYHNSIYLGDVEEQVRLLKEVGQLPLAYLAAKTHGLDEEAANILGSSGLEFEPKIPVSGELLKPPAPILKQSDLNWPQLTVARSFFEAGFVSADKLGNSIAAPVPITNNEVEDVGDWDDEDALNLPDDGVPKAKVAKVAVEENEEDGWDLDDGLDLPDTTAGLAVGTTAAVETYAPPAVGPSVSETWLRNSQLAADHIAAGSFETAMQILNRQVGAVNFAPLKAQFMSIFQSSKAYLPCNPSVIPLSVALQRSADEGKAGRAIFPFQPMTVSIMISKLQEAYTATAGGKFSAASDLFVNIIHSLLFTIAVKKSESEEIQQLLVVAREYILGLKMELSRRDPSTEPKRSIELAAYFTHCQLQPLHLQLVLSSAMTAAYKYKNFSSACQFARRLLEMGPSQAMGLKARKLLAACENNQTDEIALDYNQHNPFVVCAKSLTPIYRGSPAITCPYCAASYKPEYKGILCTICNVSAVGTTGIGLKNINELR